MFSKRTRAAAIGTVFSLVGLFGAVGSAQAAVYAGHWDPVYGDPFDSMSWTADAEFSVPNACLALGDGFHLAGTCSGFAELSGSVSFYDIASPAVPVETDAITNGFVLGGFYLSGGALEGVNGTFGQVTPTAAIAGGGQYSFSLILIDSNAQLEYVTPAGTPAGCPPGSTTPCSFGYSENQGTGQFIAVVPEPGTYALMLAGIGMMGFMARRRKS